jgi:thymidylate synthase
MAYLIRGGGIGEVWEKLLVAILEDGKEVSPRGMKTKEILNMTIEVDDGLDNIITSETRDLNYRFMVAEWLWIQAGMNDVATLALYNSMMREFSDDGVILSGAYGPRLKPQWEYIIDNLQNHDTRQAVATIFTPVPAKSRDIPCTISLQWIIREDCVNCTVNMRSSDAWLGIPYDFFTFSQLTNLVASRLDLPVGSMTMHLTSSHLYERHWRSSELELLNNTISSIYSPQLSKNTVVPDEGLLCKMLQEPHSIHGLLSEPWGSYALALSLKKKKALEVLNELSTY